MSKCFVVLGMHRSATSLVAKGLHNAGVHMGDKLIPADRGNPEGYFEDAIVSNLNRAILRKAGGDWLNPPSEDSILAVKKDTAFMDVIENLVQQRLATGAPLWGWKDPRTVLTIRLFHQFLVNPHYIAVFRNPTDVAASLFRRDRIPTSAGVALAKTYNKRLLGFLNDTTLSDNFNTLL